MNCFWLREFETAVIREAGKCSAIHSVSDPQPQPSSSTSSPSCSAARLQVRASMSDSAWSRLVTPGLKYAEEYFR